MEVKNVTPDQVVEAVAKLNEEWGGNIVLENVKAKSKNVTSFKLGTRDSRADGSRTSASERHGRWACTHVFADIMQLLLNEGGTFTRLFTGFVVENQRELDQHVDQAHHKNCGSLASPMGMQDCCVSSYCESKFHDVRQPVLVGYLR